MPLLALQIVVKEGDVADGMYFVKEGQVVVKQKVPEEELAARRDGWAPLPPVYTKGVLAKYAKLVQSASKGAVLE